VNKETATSREIAAASPGEILEGPWLIWRLAGIGACVVMAVVALLLWVAGPGSIPRPVIFAAAIGPALFGLELLLTLFTVVLRRDLRLWRTGFPQLRLVLKLAVLGGWLTRTDRERLFHSFIRANNKFLRAALNRKLRQTAGSQGALVLLAPTCLQAPDCGKEITQDAFLCERCGKCPVKDLVELASGRGLELHFVGGGTLARSLVEGRAPGAVVAVACERELTEGILFSRKVPVVAVPNTRPKGPCRETCVDMAEVEEAIEVFGA
jgi:hypothetical protein